MTDSELCEVFRKRAKVVAQARLPRELIDNVHLVAMADWVAGELGDELVLQVVAEWKD